jgi:hypothetical protein
VPAQASVVQAVVCCESKFSLPASTTLFADWRGISSRPYGVGVRKHQQRQTVRDQHGIISSICTGIIVDYSTLDSAQFVTTF